MDEFRFREAVSGDEPAIRSVVLSRRIWSKAGPREYRSRPGGRIAELHIERGGSFRILLSPENQIVGCGGLYPLDQEEAEIRKMYLLPQARGHGLGRILLRDLIERAKAAGFQRVVLEPLQC